MSFRLLSSLNSPSLVTATGAAILGIGIPFGTQVVAATSIGILKLLNCIGYAINVGAVSIPGRIDGQQDEMMRQGNFNPNKPNAPASNSEQTKLVSKEEEEKEESKLQSTTYSEIYSPARGRTLVRPSGWAFAIWGPIYLGELLFCCAQFAPSVVSAPLDAVLPGITTPFVVACLMQSLWCASFRPSYSVGTWQKYVSVFALAGTAYSLSLVHAITSITPEVSLYLLPLTMHFGWTTAATLVNINGSIAMNESTSDSTIIAVGHSSAVIGTVLGVGITLLRLSPVYGFTLAWALAACADGMRLRKQLHTDTTSNLLNNGMQVQQTLCYTGSILCVMAAISTFFL